MLKVIVIMLEKGGVGKSMLVVYFMGVLIECGFDVVFIDEDGWVGSLLCWVCCCEEGLGFLVLDVDEVKFKKLVVFDVVFIDIEGWFWCKDLWVLVECVDLILILSGLIMLELEVICELLDFFEDEGVVCWVWVVLICVFFIG